MDSEKVTIIPGLASPGKPDWQKDEERDTKRFLSLCVMWCVFVAVIYLLMRCTLRKEVNEFIADTKDVNIICVGDTPYIKGQGFDLLQQNYLQSEAKKFCEKQNSRNN